MPKARQQIQDSDLGEIEELQEISLDIPAELPILPLKNTVVYPISIFLPLVVSQERSIKLVDEVSGGNRLVALVALRDPDIEEPEPGDVYTVGTAAILHRLFKAPDGTIRIFVQGLERVKLRRFVQTEPYLKAVVDVAPDTVEDKDVEVEALMRNVADLFRRFAALVPALPEELMMAALGTDDPRQLVYLVANYVRMDMAAAQEILEIDSVKAKLKRLHDILSRELEVLELGKKIQNQAQSEMEKMQREYYLREQLKAIKKELGEEDEQAVEVKELGDKIAAAGMPEEAEKEARRELDRLAHMPMAAAEYSVIKTYLEWLIGLPWQVVTEDNLDIARASEVLEEDHYDLEKIKERILEYLAVRKLRKERADEFKREETHDYLRLEREGAILCFVGPPGTGKTSLGRSIARALGRKFVRMSLGGMRDEAEIRGHRRTYIGAMPGRVIQALKRAGSKNPVFMLDEVDKVGNDWRGDPTSALLEVLDPEQNRDYRDHYLDVPFDLSEVMFITTANQLEPIPLPLRDRMEIIQLSGYTEEEKIKIAQGYLIPRQRRENALRDGEVDFTVPALQKIVRDFTREAGVRNLEQQIGNICRKVVTRVARAAADDAALELIEPDKVVEYLGKPRYFFEAAERTEVPGVATGLSWTPTGGDIIFIEATKMKGNKGLLLTGQLGDVMKESAQAALSYVRSKAAAHGLSESFFDTADLHVHVPAGAIPKDGPSAGVTLATAILSLLTGRSVRANVAMTGEITLRGQVLPIGGLKEKILAARRAGLDTVILPKRNEPDLDDLPADVRQEMHFVLVETLDQVFAAALKETDAAGAAEPAGAAGAEAAATEGA